MRYFIIFILFNYLLFITFFESGVKFQRNIVESVREYKFSIYCSTYEKLNLENQQKLNNAYEPTNIERARCNAGIFLDDINKKLSD